MHEWALAEGVVSTATKVAKENNASNILEIRIKMGQLQQVDREVFEFALKEISKDTMAENSQIEIEKENAILECRTCGENWNYEDAKEKLSEDEEESIHFVPDLAHTYIRCPNCGSPDFKVEKGRGVWIDSVELERED